MALSENRIIFGIHSITPYQRADRMPYGAMKVIGGGTLSLSAEFEDLFGGSNKFAWASEAKTISSEFTASVKALPDFLFEVFLGACVATTSTANGSVTEALTNAKGTSVLSATTGIATATVKSGSEDDVKDGIYVVKAASTTTVDVYILSDIQFTRGTDISYENDALKVTSSALTITTSTAVTIPNTGIELTGGSGTIGMTADDTAYFKVSSNHEGVSTITIGESTATFPEHGQACYAAKRSNGDLFEIDILKAVGSGFPIGLEETVFSIPELTTKLLYDSVANAVAKIRATKAA